MFGELKDSMNRMNKGYDGKETGFDGLGKRMDALLGGPLERIERKMDMMIDDLTDCICEEEGGMYLE